MPGKGTYSPVVTTPPHSDTPASGPRILVVDDNVDAAETMVMMLQLNGHDARSAHDGPSALAEAAAYRPDLVFLDIGLPGMSGYDVARRFRADTALQGAQLVALTGWGTEDDKRKCMEAGFDLHLTKPVDPQDVDAVVARWRPATAK